MLRDNFCVFILTHGRSDRVYTYKTIRKQGYTGPVFFVVDMRTNRRTSIYGDMAMIASLYSIKPPELKRQMSLTP